MIIRKNDTSQYQLTTESAEFLVSGFELAAMALSRGFVEGHREGIAYYLFNLKLET